MQNYSLFNLAERAEKALAAHATLVEQNESAYVRMCEARHKLGIPTIGILGMGRSGKDTAAEYICSKLPSFPRPKSSSLVCLPFVAHMIGIPQDEAYATRHNNRNFWIHACHALRANDLTRLVRWCLGTCHIAIGYRGKVEFHAVNRDRIVDCTIWINNHRVPVDPTVEFQRGDCDLVIDNKTTLDEFYRRLDRFMNLYVGVSGLRQE